MRSSSEMAALFLADRIAHNDEIKAHLNAGEDVICDRYYYSSMAYQGPLTDPDWVADMNRHCPAIRKPDLCVFLDVDYRRCKERLDAGRDALEIYERDLGFMEETRNAFLSAFRRFENEDRIVVVNADREIGSVAE
jgi:dTMP kinase